VLRLVLLVGQSWSGGIFGLLRLLLLRLLSVLTALRRALFARAGHETLPLCHAGKTVQLPLWFRLCDDLHNVAQGSAFSSTAKKSHTRAAVLIRPRW
jgi:hypothetical protein